MQRLFVIWLGPELCEIWAHIQVSRIDKRRDNWTVKQFTKDWDEAKKMAHLAVMDFELEDVLERLRLKDWHILPVEPHNLNGADPT